MEPGMVWLLLIPCFGLIWQFIMIIRISESLDNEFYSRRWRRDGDFGKSLGISYAVLNLLGFIPYLGILCSLAGIVCFIMYWVKIAGYSNQLASDNDPIDDYDDDYDDRPKRKRRSRDEDDDYDDHR